MSFRQYYEEHTKIADTKERKRLCGNDVLDWRNWGPYVSERQWGTVREWYDTNGKNPWTDFVHDQARSRAYRWGEDGLAGICDNQQLMCFSLALWNERDPILKERLFGLTNAEGNHGEDVKEYYYYLDSTPTHSYMKYLYKYPYRYPYGDLLAKSHSMDPMEYELVNTGVLTDEGYFDVLVEYAKNNPDDIVIRITVSNRGKDTRTLRVLPTLLFRNTWGWSDNAPPRPNLRLGAGGPGYLCVQSSEVLGSDRLTDQRPVLLSPRWLYCRDCQEALFTDNDTNQTRCFGGVNPSPCVKDGINDYIVSLGKSSTVNPAQSGTKAAAHYTVTLAPNGSATIALRLCNGKVDAPFANFDTILAQRLQEADEFYDAICPHDRQSTVAVEQDLSRVQRQAFAGMLWSKQFYHLVANRWLKGDGSAPSPEHQNDAKMTPWSHLYSKDIISMPDKWEYPWFAAWDLAFHTTSLAIIDPDFAKFQLELLAMEWYQHPNGQLPAYEWDFSNINPPVHAWAAWRVYHTESEIYGRTDTLFLERVFSKLNLNFTWWVNKADRQGNNVFEGGFLGMDNIRIVDKDPDGQPLEQADGTAWMAMFCLNMLRISIELAALHGGPDAAEAYKYNDAARKYLQHFMYICSAMNRLGKDGLWDSNSQFFMDCANKYGRLPVFSMVGFVPLFAVEGIAQQVTDPESFYDLCGFLRWFARHRLDLIQDNAHINLDDLIAQVSQPEPPKVLSGTVSVVDKDKLTPILARLLNADEFLSPHGIRSLSKYHLDHTAVTLEGGSAPLFVAYEPAESVKMIRMGGNSNWCGPVWFPVNYMIIDALRRYDRQMDPGFKVECPTGSGKQMTLGEVADELSQRLVSIFLRDAQGRRPVFGGVDLFQQDAQFKDYLLFYEYFHGGDRDDQYAGAGLGASHQTGWTGLVANLIQELGVRQRARQLGIVEDRDLPAK